jgi:hypothetical protein
MPENKGERATRKVVSEGAKLEEMASLREQSSYGKILRSSGGSLSRGSDATDKEKLEEMASLREQSSYGKRLRSSGGSLSQEGDDFEEVKVYKTSGIGRTQICEACSSEIQGDIYHMHGEERAFQVEDGLYHLICEDCYFIWQVQGGKLILIANASTRSSARTSRRIESDGLEDQDNLTEREAEAQEDAGMQTRAAKRTAKATKIIIGELREEFATTARSELVAESDLLGRIYQDDQNRRIYQIIALEWDSKYKKVVGVRQSLDDEIVDEDDENLFLVEGENGL